MERKHFCDTTNPSRSCCWATRRAEFGNLEELAALRIARYGSEFCRQCGQGYGVDRLTMTVADHDCPLLSDAQRWA